MSEEKQADPIVEPDEDEPGAFEKATRPHWKSVYGLVYRMVRNRSAAEDLFQETLMRAYRRFDSLRDPSVLKSWLLRIARNTTLNWIKKEKPQVPVDFLDDTAADALLDEVGAGDSVEAVVEKRDQVEQATSVLAELPPIYAAILQLRYGEGLSYKELSENLQIPMSSVKFRLHQGVKLLKDRLSRTAEFLR